MVRSTPSIASLEPYIWVMFGLAAAPSVALWTGLGAHWGIRRTFAIAALVQAAGVAVSALWVTEATVIAASVFVGGTFMGLTALGLIAAREAAAIRAAASPWCPQRSAPARSWARSSPAISTTIPAASPCRRGSRRLRS